MAPVSKDGGILRACGHPSRLAALAPQDEDGVGGAGCAIPKRKTPREARGVLETQLWSVPTSYRRTDSLSSD